MITKTEAIEYIRAAGNDVGIAEYMLRNLPNSFDIDDIVPDDVYDAIVEGVAELSYSAHVLFNGE